VHIETALLAGVDLERVRDLMRTLSPMQRACFELVTVRDLSPAEVGAMHDISEATVRQHVFRARQALRKALEPEGIHD
jgi:RNA polymerase sigma factor (sigma-70 family)